MANHHAHAHDQSKAGPAVVLSLVLFFILSAAGHFVFAMRGEEVPTQHFAPAGEMLAPEAVQQPDTKPVQTHVHRKSH